jgi:hypothetical protein
MKTVGVSGGPSTQATKTAVLEAQSETPQNWAVSVKRDLSPRIAAKY